MGTFDTTDGSFALSAPHDRRRVIPRSLHLHHEMRRFLLLLLFLLFLRGPLRAADPASLQIRIEEGDGLTYPLGSRATRGITIVVSDEAGNPVEGASVSFGLPETGPSGVFSNESKTEIVTTHADGRASVWGMRWNRQAGSFNIRVTAGKGEARAGTVVSQNLAEAPAGNVGVGRSSHKWLWIALAAAGAAGVGIAVATRGGNSSNCSSTVVLPANPCVSSPDTLGVTVIGSPTINLGHP
jgi:hypothetical protein